MMILASGAGGLYPSELCGRVVLLCLYPLIHQCLRLPDAIEDFPVQQIILQRAVEALTVAILPRTARFNISVSSRRYLPANHEAFGNELRAVFISNMFRDTMHDHRFHSLLNDLVRTDMSGAVDSQAGTAVFVDHGQRAYLVPAMFRIRANS